MKSSVDVVMRVFADFLSASWGIAHQVASSLEEVEGSELVSDWAQANWEILVEAPLREMVGSRAAFLDPYSDGAECNGKSSRVWEPEALPTHRIVCLPRPGAALLDLLTNRVVEVSGSPLIFDHFAIHSEQGWHEEAAPFDCALAYHDDQEILLRLDQISFAAEELAGPLVDRDRRERE